MCHLKKFCSGNNEYYVYLKINTGTENCLHEVIFSWMSSTQSSV